MNAQKKEKKRDEKNVHEGKTWNLGLIILHPLKFSKLMKVQPVPDMVLMSVRRKQLRAEGMWYCDVEHIYLISHLSLITNF